MVRLYESFAAHYGLNNHGLVFPASVEDLALFVAYLSTFLAPRTVSNYLSAIRSHHIDLDLPIHSFSSLRIRRMLAGARRLAGPSSRLRLPITSTILSAFLRTLNLHSPLDSLYWAACCLAFFGFLRCGEFTVPSLDKFVSRRHLCVADIAFDSSSSPSVLYLFIKTSKTDQYFKGATIQIGVSGSPVCAVKAVAHFLHSRGNSSGPLFLFPNGTPLTRQLLTTFLRERLQYCGFPGYYAPHSFRIGAATAAAAAGVPDHIIKAMGRWRSEAYQAYIRLPTTRVLQVASLLVAS